MKHFSKRILSWYNRNARNLPWRSTRDPYLIWLSEIILQQTRIDQGMDYYLKFIKKFPRIEMLASAPESEVLKMWQGLGYYSRARNLLYAANQVMDEFDGKFPHKYSEIKSLKGVGDYTAAAIASIAFGEAKPVVDGNVKRVISRLYGLEISGTILYNRTREIMGHEIDVNNPGDFNQAVMEFGAIHCTPNSPSCNICIFNKDCIALKNNLVNKLPLRSTTKKPAVKFFSYLVIHIPGANGGLVFKKRTEDGIWKNMYDFPLIESIKKPDIAKLEADHKNAAYFQKGFKVSKSSKLIKHQLTHITIMAQFHHVNLKSVKEINLQPDWEIVPLPNISALPIPRLIDRYLETYREENEF